MNCKFFLGWNDQNLEAHNVLRKLHGAPPMTVDASMTASAQAWAERMASMGKLEHAKSGSPDNPDKDGENIAYMCLMPGEEYPGQRPVKMWYVPKASQSCKNTVKIC